MRVVTVARVLGVPSLSRLLTVYGSRTSRRSRSSGAPVAGDRARRGFQLAHRSRPQHAGDGHRPASTTGGRPPLRSRKTVRLPSLQSTLIDRTPLRDRVHAKRALFRYIESWYTTRNVGTPASSVTRGHRGLPALPELWCRRALVVRREGGRCVPPTRQLGR